jgi:uncharacterized protein (UPF0147 family)
MDYVSNDEILEGQRTAMAKKSIFEDIDLLGATFADLRGRQSVRATFKLTSDCIDAIGIVAAQLGIKQKSLFDHLFQDTDTLSSIARKVKNAQPRATDRVQKTYVMSRSALLQLEEIARHFNAPRDVLIEFSVQRLLPIIANERKRYQKRKEIFMQIQQHLEQGRKLLKIAFAELGEDDPLTDRLTAAMGVYESASKQIAAVMEKGKDIETFEPESFSRVEIRFEED